VTQLAYTIKDVAFGLGFDRRAVAALCNSGELGFIPCRDAQGKPSRIHKRIPHSEVEAWLKKNTIRTPEQFKAVLDGRRK
jgi:hypothetical protein